MFTGIIEVIGKVESSASRGGTVSLKIGAAGYFAGSKNGDSIAVNGVCLTIASKGGDWAVFDIMDETLKKTALKSLKRGGMVNLERSLRVGDRMGGHFVYGHIDGPREVADIRMTGETAVMDIKLNDADKEYAVLKGSIAIDGISLTIGEVTGEGVRLFLIPHTLRNTTLLERKKGDLVNVELDMLAKYARGKAKHGDVTTKLLEDSGFI